jgi:hypothetical protein
MGSGTLKKELATLIRCLATYKPNAIESMESTYSAADRLICAAAATPHEQLLFPPSTLDSLAGLITMHGGGSQVTKLCCLVLGAVLQGERARQQARAHEATLRCMELAHECCAGPTNSAALFCRLP